MTTHNSLAKSLHKIFEENREFLGQDDAATMQQAWGALCNLSVSKALQEMLERRVFTVAEVDVLREVIQELSTRIDALRVAFIKGWDERSKLGAKLKTVSESEQHMRALLGQLYPHPTPDAEEDKIAQAAAKKIMAKLAGAYQHIDLIEAAVKEAIVEERNRSK